MDSISESSDSSVEIAIAIEFVVTRDPPLGLRSK